MTHRPDQGSGTIAGKGVGKGNLGMEDYAGAYLARKTDVEVLLAAEGPREVGAFHMGGIAVECRVKALLVCYHGISEWKQPSKRPGDPMSRRSIENPEHGLITAIKHMARLYQRAKSDPLFLKHLNQILHPTGATAGLHCHTILLG